jgi:hypothetical protein
MVCHDAEGHVALSALLSAATTGLGLVRYIPRKNLLAGNLMDLDTGFVAQASPKVCFVMGLLGRPNHLLAG